MHIFTCEMDIACTYALSKPRISRDCAIKAFFAALNMERPDLMYRATEFLAALGAVE